MRKILPQCWKFTSYESKIMEKTYPQINLYIFSSSQMSVDYKKNTKDDFSP